MRPPSVYNVVAVLSAPVLYGPYRLRFRGTENLPSSGGYVLTSNHVSSFDPWPLGMPLWPKHWLRIMAKSELYWWPLRLIIDGAGAFKVRRGQADTEAISTAVRLAREGHAVMMFPEGTRRTKGLVKKHEARPRTGAARIAIEAGARLGWDRWIGERGHFIGMTGFGASAPAPDLYRHFGITAEALVEAANALV